MIDWRDNLISMGAYTIGLTTGFFVRNYGWEIPLGALVFLLTITLLDMIFQNERHNKTQNK